MSQRIEQLLFFTVNRFAVAMTAVKNDSDPLGRARAGCVYHANKGMRERHAAPTGIESDTVAQPESKNLLGFSRLNVIMRSLTQTV